MFTSGVDRKLNQFRLVETASSFSKQAMPSNNSASEVVASARTKWVLAGNRRFHSHDVRALALEENRPINALVSGGIDMSLVVSPAREFPNSNQRRLPFLPQKPLVSISKSKRLMMCRFTNAVKVWRLGKSTINVLSTCPISDAFAFTSSLIERLSPRLQPLHRLSLIMT